MQALSTIDMYIHQITALAFNVYLPRQLQVRPSLPHDYGVVSLAVSACIW